MNGTIDNLRLLQEAMSTARLSARHNGTTHLQAFRKALYCLREARMRPHEALEFGLLAAHGPAPGELLSKRRCVGLQKHLNPPHWFWVTEDKSVFHRFCEAANVPVPECYAILLRGCDGLAHDRPIRPTRKAWRGFLDTLVLRETFIKPCRHSRGRGIVTPDSDGGFLRAGDRRINTVSELVDFLFEDPELDSWIVQRRVHPHPELEALSGTPYLQSLRMYTFVERDGAISVLPGFVKVIAGGATVDTLTQGDAVNMRAPVDLASGQLLDAVGCAADYTWSSVPHHPRTERRFAGFQLPFWPQATQIITQAAEVFQPIRTLAWDIAITANGPVIIEANIRWDPPNFHLPTVQRLRAALERCCAE